MAPIRKAKGYVSYVFAILISGLFSILGRSQPSWAEEAKVDYNEKTFREMYQVAQAATENKDIKLKNGVQREVGVAPNRIDAVVVERIFPGLNLDVNYIVMLNNQYRDRFNTIRAKFENKEALTDDELVFFREVYTDFVNSDLKLNPRFVPARD